MKPNANIALASIAALCVLLAGCKHETGKPVEPPIKVAQKVAEKSDITVVEMEPDDQLDKALEAFAKNEYSQCATYNKGSGKID